MIEITKHDPLTGKMNTMKLPITQEEYDKWFLGNVPIQHAFPNLSADQREFLLTGLMPDSWDAVFNSAEDDEDRDSEKEDTTPNYQVGFVGFFRDRG